MKKIAQLYLSVLIVLLSVLLCMPSCKSDDDDTSVDDYCYISAFSLGTVKRAIHVTTTSGNDSLYYISYSASLYPMSINQKTGVIENLDSLPYGTITSAALSTISYTGDAVYYRSADDSGDILSYSSEDSINFSYPLHFYVVPTSHTSTRVYTVKVNVHQTNGDKFVWSKQNESDALAPLKEREMVAYHGNLVMMATDSIGRVMYAHCSTTDSVDWKVEGATGADAANIHTLCVCRDTLMMSTTAGALLTSTDGATWTPKGSAVQSGLRLLGCSSARFYAMLNDSVVSSTDGTEWRREPLDSDAGLLPEQQPRLNDFSLANNSERLVLTGISSQTGDKKGTVWSKTWNKWTGENDPSWMYYPHTEDNKWKLPEMTPLYVMPYDGGLIAVGGKSSDGTYAALGTMLYSIDYGLTWKTKDELTMPSALKGTTEPLAVAVDSNKFVWVIAGNQTWRGRLNRLGFAK